ncbi:hypothetical protein BC628DRAFT_1417553 [Trametes gibbosa]|nr:hypothetical protein BC628DRAFT_1417553 [Trametes gibbosa]
MAPRKLNDMDVAAILWKLHQKRQLQLDPAQVRWLETLLGPDRLRREVSRDPELLADAANKELAAMALLLAAHHDTGKPLDGMDLHAVTGLHVIVRDTYLNAAAAASDRTYAAASGSTKRKRGQ